MTAKVIPFSRLRGRAIPEWLLQDVLGGRYRGDWTAHDYLVAVRELYHYGVVETPGLYEAEAIRDMALVPVTIEGDGRRWFVRRMRGGSVACG